MKPKMTNTHRQLNKQYDKCVESIQVLEDDAEALLLQIQNGGDAETDTQWYSLIRKDLTRAYKLKTKILDDLNDLDLYDIDYK